MYSKLSARKYYETHRRKEKTLKVCARPICGTEFVGPGKKRYCCQYCAVSHYRALHPTRKRYYQAVTVDKFSADEQEPKPKKRAPLPRTHTGYPPAWKCPCLDCRDARDARALQLARATVQGVAL